MFGGFKQRASNKALKKQRRQMVCKRRFHNLTTAKSIGLLYSCDDVDSQEMDNFIRFLTDRRIKVRSLGYTSESKKTAPPATKATQQWFKKSQLNWFGKPVSAELDAFIAEPFDILIDFSREKKYSLHYIATLSHAAMRVGQLAYLENPYEFILSMPSDSDNKAYIEQLKNYLQTIQIA